MTDQALLKEFVRNGSAQAFRGLVARYTGLVFYPRCISHLGKGRIVCLQWNGAQQDLEAMTSGKFYVRCIQWLANRPLDQ
jgi:hypothetical protein